MEKTKSREKRKNMAFFLLGSTVWIPFLLLAYDLSPYKLTIEGDLWGWRMREWVTEGLPEGNIPEGCFTGFFALFIFYALYALVIGIILLLAKPTKGATKPKTDEKIKTFWSWYPWFLKGAVLAIAKTAREDAELEKIVGFWGTIIGAVLFAAFFGFELAVLWFAVFHLIFLHGIYRQKKERREI